MDGNIIGFIIFVLLAIHVFGSGNHGGDPPDYTKYIGDF